MSFEDRVLSFETLKEFFEDLEQIFRGNDLILENKTIAMNKTVDARLCLPEPALKCMQIFFRVMHFLKGTCGSLSTLKLVTFLPYAFIALPAGASEFFFSLRDYNPEGGCCFHLHNFNRPPKCKQTV